MRILLILLQLLQVVAMNTPEDEKERTPDMKCEPPERESSIKSTLLMLLFLVPVIGVFLPWTRDAIREGLSILNEIPDWFSFIIVLGVLSMFGLRKQLTDILINFTNFRKNK